MASGTAQSEKALAKAKSVFAAIDLGRVQIESWKVLRESNNSSELKNLNIGTDHLTVEVFASLATAVKAVDQRCPKLFWEWMALPVQSSAQGRKSALPRVKALMVVLAQVIGRASGEIAASASTAYLALLGAKGAGALFSILAQPLVFMRLMKMFDPLCTYSHRRGSAELSEALEGDADAAELPPAVDEDMDEANLCTASEALDLLAALVELLRSHSLSSTPGILGMVTEKLIALTLHPVEETVAQVAVAALSAAIAGAGSEEEVRRVAVEVMRAVLPGVMMTQEIKYLNQATVPKLLQCVRSVVLDLLCDIAGQHPGLMNSRAHSRLEGAQDQEQGANASGLDSPWLAMLQLIVVKAPDRAEWRLSAAESFVHLLSATVAGETEQVDAQQQGLDFIGKLLRCERAPWRGMAVDATMLLMEHGGNLAGKEGLAHFERRLLEDLVERCSDSTAAVRGRALHGVAAAILHLSKRPEGVKVVCEVLWDSERESKTVNTVEHHASQMDLATLFTRAAKDESGKVRRIALTLFDAALPIISSMQHCNTQTALGYFNLELLGRLASDESVMVRKAAICSLSILLRTCPTEVTAILWVGNVLPLTFDPEASVIERAIHDVDVVMWHPLSRPNDSNEDKVDEALSLVSAIVERESESMQYLRCALRDHAKRGMGTDLGVLMTAVLEDTRERLEQPLSQWPLVNWIVLEELAALGAASRSKSAPIITLKAWERFENSNGATDLEGSKLATQILRVIEHLSPNLPQMSAEPLRDNFLDRLEKLELSAEGTRSALSLIAKIEDRRRGDGTARAGCSWRLKLIRSLEAKLLVFVKNFDAARRQSVGLSRCLFTLGQLALSDKSAAEGISQRTVSDIQSIATNTILGEGPPTAADITLRSHAFAALGKVCLRREDLAKRLVEVFVLHLSPREPSTVRSNVLIVLRDLCEAYTSLVDRFVSSMADCLRDDNAFLRKQAVIVLASLLSEKYVTFRGDIVYRFLYVLGDPVDSIRGLAESIVIRILQPQYPALFANNFLDVVCTLNNWTGHANFQGACGNSDFALIQFPQRRSKIYSFLLSLMSNEQKLTIYSQLVTAFLAPFLDGETCVELPRVREDAGGQALHDVLALLMSKELRMCFVAKRMSDGDDADPDGEPTTAQQATESTRCALKLMLKSIVCEHIMPVLIPLKHLMETRHSPFLGELRRCMCAMVREFKEEVRDIMAADPQLANELAFDLGRADQVPHAPRQRKPEEAARERRQDAAAQHTKRARSPMARRADKMHVASPQKKQRLQELPTPQRKSYSASASSGMRAGVEDMPAAPLSYRAARQQPASSSSSSSSMPAHLEAASTPSGGGGLMGLIMRSRQSQATA